jgi:DNA-binding transcriptional ArsR family regulator
MVPQQWKFVTTHATVLLEFALDCQATVSDVAARLGISERTVQGVLRDLIDQGYVTRRRIGRSNRYEVNGDKPLRHERLSQLRVADLLALAAPEGARPWSATRPA